MVYSRILEFSILFSRTDTHDKNIHFYGGILSNRKRVDDFNSLKVTTKHIFIFPEIRDFQV